MYLPQNTAVLFLSRVRGSIPYPKQPSLQLRPPAGMSKRLRSQLEQASTEDACSEIHLEPPQLFCDENQITRCDKYLLYQEHRNHVVYRVQEAAENYRVSFMRVEERCVTLAASSYLLPYLFGEQIFGSSKTIPLVDV